MPHDLDVAIAVAFLATSLTVVTEWPQIRKLRRTHDISGVSISAATLSVVSESAWIVYVWGVGLWDALPESVLSGAVSLALVLALVRAGGMWVVPAALAAGWGAALLWSRSLGGTSQLGALLSIAYGVQLTPAVWAAWRTWCPSGIAWSSWAIRLTQSVLWGGYGLLRHDRPLVTLGVLGTIGSAAVLGRSAHTRARSGCGPDPVARPRARAAAGVTVYDPGLLKGVTT